MLHACSFTFTSDFVGVAGELTGDSLVKSVAGYTLAVDRVPLLLVALRDERRML